MLRGFRSLDIGVCWWVNDEEGISGGYVHIRRAVLNNLAPLWYPSF